MQLDPDAQLLLDAMIRAGRPQFETLTPVAARQQMRDIRAALKQPQPPVVEVRELAAQGPHGAIPLRLYRHRALAARALQPVVVFFHGGGWVFGDLETHDNLPQPRERGRLQRGLGRLPARAGSEVSGGGR
jgi:acetyl esterase